MSGPAPIPLVNLARLHASIRVELDAAIARVVDHGRFVNGPEVAELEAGFGRFVDSPHVVGVGSGTDALFLALKVLGVGPGDRVVVPDLTFVATAEAVALTGAEPLLADVDPQTGLLDPEHLREALARPGGARVKAAVFVALYGSAVHLTEVSRACRQAGLPLVCDAAQAHGALAGGRSIVHQADVTCYSFFPGKNLGALGDAGAVACADAERAARLASLRDHGRTSKHRHEVPGTNSRMDTLQAAVLSVKLAHLPAWNENRRRRAALYRELLAASPGLEVVRQEDAGSASAHHLLVVRTRQRDAVIRRLEAAGIGWGIHYPVPVHLQPAFAPAGCRPAQFPGARRLADEVLSLPLDGTIREDEVRRVASVAAAPP